MSKIGHVDHAVYFFFITLNISFIEIIITRQVF